MRPGRTATPRPLLAGLTAGATLVLAALLWVFLAPSALGGDFSYVLIRGTSMAPELVNDDLVLLRRAADYDVGDAVAYHNGLLGTTVLHRIVDDDGKRFTLRGDNRDTDDSYFPTPDEIVGKEWVVVPGGARVVRELQTPKNAALLTVA
ncbi:MAG: S26 family signal peptidase, partial [Dehalococcoidia bacterium]